MRYNTYQNSQYQNRRSYGRQEAKTPNLGKRLIEEFLTQLIFCGIIIGLIAGIQLLGLTSFNEQGEKIKHAITYSPSFNQIMGDVKEATSAMIEKVGQQDQHMDDEIIPEFIIDGQIF